MRVLCMPDWRATNPYQTLLCDALERQGVGVALASPRGWLPVRAALRGSAWPPLVHLHWAHPFIRRVVPFLGRSNDAHAAVAACRTLAEVAVLKRRGVRFVWTVHNLVNHDRHHARVEAVFNRSLARLSHRLIVHYPEAAAIVRAAYGLDEAATIDVVPHGHFIGTYPDRLPRSEARVRLGLEARHRVLLFFGKVRPYKGLGPLLDAFARLESDAARLVIAGRPEPPGAAEALAARCAGDPRIVLRLGYVGDEEVQTYLNAADAVVLPAADILTSGSAVLAMSFRKALVAAETPHLRYLAGDGAGENGGGVLYDARRQDGLLRALERVLASDTDRMGARNFDFIRRFSWDDAAASTRAVYEAALGSQAGRPAAVGAPV